MIPVSFFMGFSNRGKIREQEVVLDGKHSQLASRIKAIEIKTDSLAETIQKLSDQMEAANDNALATNEEPVSDNVAVTETIEPIEITESSQSAETPQTISASVPETASIEEEAPKATAPAIPSTPTVTKTIQPQVSSANDFEELENDLSSRWMQWVGGVALALGGAFLVKYSIDAGLLSPAVRVSLGTLMGLLLTFGGEFVRQKSASLNWMEGKPDYVPSALSAAGLFTLFASIFGAYSLYSLIPAWLTFSGLALVSLGAVALASVQGRFFAYLGMLGGLVVPLLVSTGNGSAYTLFPYLLFITAATLYIAREKSWVDVAATAIGTAAAWSLLWVTSNWAAGDAIPVGLYLLSLSGLSYVFLHGATPERSNDQHLDCIIPTHVISLVSDGVMALTLILLAAIVRLEHYNTISLLIFASSLLLTAYAVYKDAEYDLVAVLGMLASLFLLGTWHEPSFLEVQAITDENTAQHLALSPIAPPGFTSFVTVAVLLAGSIGSIIFTALSKLLRKPLWASAGAAYPVAVLVICYARLNDFEVSIAFAGVALLIAGLYTAAIKHLHKLEIKTPLAVYAAGATGAVALALTMILRDAWLSFALALEILALGQIWRMYPIKGLRTFALLIAGAVLARLCLNSYIFEYGNQGPLPVINWLFYGYGLTAIIFALAAKIFKTDDSEEDTLIQTLKGGAVLLAVAFTTLEIRVLFSDSGSLLEDITEWEIALQIINWSVASAVIYWMEVKTSNFVYTLLRKFMTVVSLGALLIGGGITNNIFLGADNIGAAFLFNMQLALYLTPAALYAYKAYLARSVNNDKSFKLYATVAFALSFLWLSAEIRHTFHPYGDSNAMSNWELYSYSAAWLAYSAVLLLAGIRYHAQKIRMAGLTLLGLVVLKVFLVDMANLEGLARALSFIGLGGSLIGLGYIYQHITPKKKPQ